MAIPKGFHSYVVKLILSDRQADLRPVRAAVLSVVAMTVEGAIQSVRETNLFQNAEEWRVEYVREGVVT